ncbi:protein NRT1/ PTR FAMILY 2.8 [Citrus sinensis]|nr:protein NRT1/ PTR FAMILY 2.8 [Citrus sinensis]
MANNIHSSSASTVEQDPSAKKPGGWRAIKYILGNETFEKLASMSLISNITVYLQTNYNLGGVLLVNIVTIWSGSSNITSLLGAFVSDAYLGRFRTLLVGSIASLLGMLIMTLTAGIHQLRPSSCSDPPNCPQPQGWQFCVLFAALTLLSIGAGGIRPCNIAFGADQFDTTTEKGRAQLESFFNWWYFSFTVALVVVLTGVVYIQTNVSWVLGFAIPTACLAFSITLFLLGRRCYIYIKPAGSVFSDMAKVVVAACRKRCFSVEPGCEHNYYDPPLMIKLKRTNRFNHELQEQGTPKNGWRLCSLQQVEQLKCLIAILPVCVSGIACFISMDQQNTFGILQAIQMNKSVGPHFKMPPAWMNITSMLALSLWILIYERLYIPVATKIAGKVKRLTLQQRIKTGIVMSILCMLVAGSVEKRRRELALKHDSFVSPMSLLILLPQYALSGLTEAFAAVAIMEFFTNQMPESMRTVAGAAFFLSLSVASYVSSLVINIIHRVTKRTGNSPWLGGHDLNKNRLDYYYYIIAGLGAVNFVYFSFFASHFVVNTTVAETGVKDVQLENVVAGNSANLPRRESIDEEKGLERPDTS